MQTTHFLFKTWKSCRSSLRLNIVANNINQTTSTGAMTTTKCSQKYAKRFVLSVRYKCVCVCMDFNFLGWALHRPRKYFLAQNKKEKRMKCMKQKKFKRFSCV